MKEQILIWIVADDPYIRMSLTSLVENIPNCIVSGQSDPTEVLTAIEEDPVGVEIDLMIWDWGWAPDEQTLPNFHDLDLPVILLLDSEEHAIQAWASGVKAIIPRMIDEDRLLPVIIGIRHGFLVFDPALAQSLFPNKPLFIDETVDPPTPRELEVLRLISEGLTNKAIGKRLDISEHTVKFHVNSLLSKLNVQSRTEAVVRATQLGLIAL